MEAIFIAIELNIGEPNPKQREFMTSTKRYTAYGGARGGGKSWCVRKKAQLLALRYSGITILIMRRTFPELLQNHILPLQADLNPLIKAGVCKYKEQDKTFYFKNTSKILFGYCDSDRDVNRYQGNEYDIVFMDEATHFTEFMYDRIKVCIRGTNPFPKRMYITCNPGGVGHDWVKRLFVTREFRIGENPDDYTFIKATVYDNKALAENDPEYVRQLETLPEELRKAWLEGSWDLFAGQYFPEWNPSVHVEKPFIIPAHWRIYRCIDYGLDMLACYWVAVDTRGNCHVYRELYEGRDNHKGENNAGHTVSSACERILEMSPPEEDVYMTLAPPDLWNRNRDTGKSTADIFREHGISLVKSNNDRVAGWFAVKELFRVVPDEQEQPSSKLKIFDSCYNLIRCIPALQYDEKNANDVATEPHEITHAPDALRYFAIYWTTNASEAQTTIKKKWTSDMLEDYNNADPTMRKYLLQKYGNPS